MAEKARVEAEEREHATSVAAAAAAEAAAQLVRGRRIFLPSNFDSFSRTRTRDGQHQPCKWWFGQYV